MEFFSQFGGQFLLLIKGAILLFLAIYIVFASIVIRQVRVMTDTLQVGFEKPIKTLVFVHFAFAVGLFIFSLFVL